MPLLPVLASQAGEAYRRGDYAECLDVLRKLQHEAQEDDSKLSLNLALAEFARENCKNPKTIMKRLTEVLYQAGFKVKREKRARKLAAVGESKEKADAEQSFLVKPGFATVLYNLAALLHQARHTSATMNHLETIFENLGALEEQLVARSCLLLLEIYSTVLRGCGCLHAQRALFLERANQVLEYCNGKRLVDNGGTGKSGGGKSGPGNGKDGSSLLNRQYRLRLNIVMAKVALSVDDVRKSKRPIMAAGTLLEQSSKNELVGVAAAEDWNDRTSDFSFAMQMLKANQEYLRHEYRKSVKLLHTFSATGPQQALFYNNMGCIHYKLDKYTSAAFYFTRALQLSVAQKQRGASHESGKRALPSHNQRTALGNHGEISYNNGMALLAAQDYVSAFKCFQKAAFVFSSWPCLWFRMAECCIKTHRITPIPLVQAALGSGRMHRFLLSSTQLPGRRGSATSGRAIGRGDDFSLGTKTGGNSSDGSGDGDGDDGSLGQTKAKSKALQFMTLAHAQQYLQNALVLIDRYDQNPTSSTKNGASGHKAKADSPAVGAGSHTASLGKIKQAVLLNSAFVSLSLNNPVQTVLHAKQLLDMPDCDVVAETQARLYCAEAQCLLSRVSEAQRTLAESTAVLQSLPERERIALLVANANVLILQDQLGEAAAMARQALKLNPGLSEGLRLMVYINLKRGRTAQALRLIKRQGSPDE